MSDSYLSPEDLLQRMRAGVTDTYSIKLRQLTIPVRLLSLDERVDMRQRMLVENRKINGDDVSYSALIQKETLRMAATMSDGSTMLSAKLISFMTLDEVNYLFLEYERVCEQVNPSLDTMKPEQFQALVEAVKKNHMEVSELNLPQLKAICLAYQDLIQRLDSAPSPLDNSSGGPS